MARLGAATVAWVLGAVVILQGAFIVILMRGRDDPPHDYGIRSGVAPDRGSRAEDPIEPAQAEVAPTEQERGIPDGTHIVGKDIQPGQYRTTARGGCYYARLRGFSGLEDILSNENVSPGTQAIVTIKPTDKGFKSEGCGRWEPVE